MNVRTGGGTSHRMPECDERNTRASQISHQSLSLGAIGSDRYVYGVAMIEAQVVVYRRLAKCADWQRMVESGREEALNFCGIG